MNDGGAGVTVAPEDVLRFWFGDDPQSAHCVRQQARLWFGGGAAFDRLIAGRFGHLPPLAADGVLDDWRREPRSCLALVLVLDQFPRNLYRDSAQSFEYDACALAIAEEAIAAGFDQAVSPVEASFFYMPLEHSEDIASQDRCVGLFRQLLERARTDVHQQCASFLTYAERHREVIRRFGRFPHRNRILERATTSEERAYLDAGGETFGGSTS